MRTLPQKVNLDQFFTTEELEKEKQLPPLSKNEEDKMRLLAKELLKLVLEKNKTCYTNIR